MSSRSSLYHLPTLDEVNDHGGNRISQKIITICEKIARDGGMDVGVVKGCGGKAVKADGVEGKKRKAQTTVKEEAPREKKSTARVD
jgi:hypothetical protein